jgi:hypothetical protein
MSTITRLPNRPLRPREVTDLDGDVLRVVPYGGIPESGEVRVYALKMADGDRAHALGFEDDHDRWRHLATVDADGLPAADAELESILDEWVQERYGGRFEILKAP